MLRVLLLYAGALSGVQTFAPEAARQLHEVPAAWAAMCLTVYMVRAPPAWWSAASWPPIRRAASGSSAAASASPALIALTHRLRAAGADGGAGAVRADGHRLGPRRPVARPDRQARRAANATGRVYGVVYSGLDIGQAVAPLVFGPLMDLHRPADVWLGIALMQGVLIVSAFNVWRVRRTALAPAAI